jgi:GTP-binding protein YchF
MSLQVGIIGMPNAGKSTLLNALTHAHAESSNYPFCTIEKNVGVTTIEDPRLHSLAEALHPEEVVPATIQFVDIAGLVRGASKGEGLGNKFLGHIREADALLHVVRAFQDEATVHVEGGIDPLRDCEVVMLELMLADLETVERQAEKVRKQAKGNPKEAAEALDELDRLAGILRKGIPLSVLLHPGDPAAGPEAQVPALRVRARDLFLLTLKPTLLVVNVDEGAAGESGALEPPLVESLRRASGAEVVPLAIRLEEELSRLSPEEREEMVRELSLPGDGLRRLIEESRRLLGLITFYTTANDKLKAWLIPAGTTAPEAAGRIHTDMQRGFIRVEVFSHSDLVRHGSRAELHKHGLVRTEGKEYVVRDGDVVQVLFHP